MTIQVRFACGHVLSVGVNADTMPVCACGETRIVSTLAPAPRFVGTCSGPYCETKALDAAVVNLAPGGSLMLKPQE